ncbi:MAG: Ig-like domain-containing protein [Leptospirales bacterium]
MLCEKIVKFIFLTFLALVLIASGACSSQDADDDGAFASPQAGASQERMQTPVVAVTATLKDSYANPLEGRRFTVQADGGSSTRSLTDASGTLSLRLIPGTIYTLRPVSPGDSGLRSADSNENGFLKLSVNATGEVNVTDSRGLFANDLRVQVSDPATNDPAAGKFQSARFNETVFAP